MNPDFEPLGKLAEPVQKLIARGGVSKNHPVIRGSGDDMIPASWNLDWQQPGHTGSFTSPFAEPAIPVKCAIGHCSFHLLNALIQSG